MSPDNWLLLYAAGAVVALIVLIARFKVHPFVALIVVRTASVHPSDGVKSPPAHKVTKISTSSSSV